MSTLYRDNDPTPSPRLWNSLRILPWPVQMFAFVCSLAIIAGLVATVIAFTMDPQQRSEIGPDGSGLPAVLEFLRSYVALYFIALFFVLGAVRNPAPRIRWGVIFWAVMWAATSLFIGFRNARFTGTSIDWVTITLGVVFPAALAALWFFPSVGEYLRARPRDS